jgi:hypothetical protein
MKIIGVTSPAQLWAAGDHRFRKKVEASGVDQPTG